MWPFSSYQESPSLTFWVYVFLFHLNFYDCFLLSNIVLLFSSFQEPPIKYFVGFFFFSIYSFLFVTIFSFFRASNLRWIFGLFKILCDYFLILKSHPWTCCEKVFSFSRAILSNLGWLSPRPLKSPVSSLCDCFIIFKAQHFQHKTLCFHSLKLLVILYFVWLTAIILSERHDY